MCIGSLLVQTFAARQSAAVPGVTITLSAQGQEPTVEAWKLGLLAYAGQLNIQPEVTAEVPVEGQAAQLVAAVPDGEAAQAAPVAQVPVEQTAAVPVQTEQAAVQTAAPVQAEAVPVQPETAEVQTPETAEPVQPETVANRLGDEDAEELTEDE